MAFQSVPETAEITIVVNAGGTTPAVMTFHARKPGGYGLADLNILSTLADNWAALEFLPLVSNQVEYLRAEVRGLEFENDQISTQTNGAGVGSVLSDRLPISNTLAITKASAFTGRSARGRIFWIGLAENQVGGELVATVNADAIRDAVDAMRVAIDLSTWDPVIVSRFAGGVQRATGVTFAWVSTRYFDRIVDIQRGRLPG